MPSPPPSTWDLNGLSRDVATGRLFDVLADLEQVREGGIWKRLWLVPTGDVQRWMFGDGVALFHAHLRAGDPTYRPLVQLLLQRHLLNLAVRRRPASFIHFCRRLPLTVAAEVAELWKRADLPAAMAPRTVREQEAVFAARLLWVAERLEPMLPWAAGLVRKVAEGRTPALSETDGPCVRVVFASMGGNSLRHGALIRFVLLAERDGEGPLVHHEAVFDANFRGALDAAMDRVGGRRFRTMQHEWGFLPAGSLCDTSGFLAVRIAQSLAMDGGGTECHGLPSWLVVSGSLADDGSGATPAGHFHRKCAQLIEEGVRVLLVVDEKGRSNVPVSSARAEGVELPGADDLLIVRCRDYDEAIAQLRERDWTWPVRAPGVRRPFTSIDLGRIGVRMPQQTAGSDYQCPEWFLEQLLEAMRTLSGRGYLHVEAPAAWGKSELATFLKTPSEKWRRFGTVLRYRVLHGVLENPELFLNLVCNQCQRAVPDEAPLPVFNPADIQNLQDARWRVAELLRRTMEFCGTGRLLLVLDGLDELTDARGRNLLNVLPAPEDLANGCFILLLSRPHVRPGIADGLTRFRSVPDLFATLSLNADDPRYQKLMKQFAQQRLPKTAIADEGEVLFVRAMRALNGRGYLHIKAPAEWGTLESAKFLKTYSDNSHPFGEAFRYCVLHGDFEISEQFLSHVWDQCERVVPNKALLADLDLADIRDVRDARGRLAELLRRTTEHCSMDRLLLVLDGLELTESRAEELLDILPAPERLAKGCFILLRSFPQESPDIVGRLDRLRSTPEWFVTLSLQEDVPENRKWMTNFSQQGLAEGAAATRSDDLTPDQSEVLQRANNFLHLRLLCELEKNKDLSQVAPESEVSQAFAKKLDRVANQVQGTVETFRTWHWPVLRSAAAAGTVSRADLRRTIDRDWNDKARDMLDRTLDELVDNALLVAENRTDLPDDTLFSTIHEEFANWLRKTDELNWNMKSGS